MDLRQVLVVIGSLLAVGATPIADASQPGFTAEFSFGDQLRLFNDPQRVYLTISNTSTEPASCFITVLTDPGSPNIAHGRVRFRLVDNQPHCASNGCLNDIHPAARVALWGDIGPFEPGETKTCAYDVYAMQPGFGQLSLSEWNGLSITVLESSALPVNSLNGLAIALLIALTLLVASAALRRPD